MKLSFDIVFKTVMLLGTVAIIISFAFTFETTSNAEHNREKIGERIDRVEDRGKTRYIEINKRLIRIEDKLDKLIK